MPLDTTAPDRPPRAAVAAALAAEREWLVRFCGRLGGPVAAEDLAQDALLEAWRQSHKLRDPSGARPWLAAVARNLSRRRNRTLARERTVFPRADADDPDDAIAAVVDPAADDPSAIVERGELAALLQRAMAGLPTTTRAALVARHGLGVPLAEVATGLGLGEDATAKRLERGIRAARKALEIDLAVEAAAYGPPGSALVPDRFRDTPVWCPLCGARRLEGRFDPDRPLLVMRCPACHPPGVHLASTATLDIFRGLSTYKPALSRLTTLGHDLYAGALATGGARCLRCGKAAALVREMPPDGPLRDIRGVYLRCVDCRPHFDISLGGLALWRPEGRAFWREHARIRLLPEREETHEGRPAIVERFEARGSAARFEVVFAADTYEVLEAHACRDG